MEMKNYLEKILMKKLDKKGLNLFQDIQEMFDFHVKDFSSLDPDK